MSSTPLDQAIRAATAVKILTECEHLGPVNLAPYLPATTQIYWCAGCGAIKQGDAQWTYPVRVHEVMFAAEGRERDELVGELEASIDHVKWRKKISQRAGVRR